MSSQYIIKEFSTKHKKMTYVGVAGVIPVDPNPEGPFFARSKDSIDLLSFSYV